MATNLPRRQWSVGFTLEPELVPASMRAAALTLARHNLPTPNSVLLCWTFRGAQRKLRRWNRLRSAWRQPGTWEVYGPRGKGLDGDD
jgi:hypothetical protein